MTQITALIDTNSFIQFYMYSKCRENVNYIKIANKPILKFER